MDYRIKVLVVDDLRLARRAACDIFKKFNCKINIVSSGNEALQNVLIQHYDIMFIDIQLPDISGFEVAKTIRTLQRKFRIPLIAVTTNSNEGLELETKAAGFDDFLLKPLSIESVRHILNKHLPPSRGFVE